MARKKKFSSNGKKAKRRVTRLHSKIAKIRKDFLHKSSKDISKNHAVVFVEDLQVKNMSASSNGRKAKSGKRVAQKSGLNRAILDARPINRLSVGQIYGNRQSVSQIPSGHSQACARGASAPARSRVERLYPRRDDLLQQAALHPGAAWNRQRHEMEG